MPHTNDCPTPKCSQKIVVDSFFRGSFSRIYDDAKNECNVFVAAARSTRCDATPLTTTSGRVMAFGRTIFSTGGTNRPGRRPIVTEWRWGNLVKNFDTPPYGPYGLTGAHSGEML